MQYQADQSFKQYRNNDRHLEFFDCWSKIELLTTGCIVILFFTVTGIAGWRERSTAKANEATGKEKQTVAIQKNM